MLCKFTHPSARRDTVCEPRPRERGPSLVCVRVCRSWVMRQVLLACCGTMALVSAATAADLPPRYPVTRAPIYAPVYNWTGFYLGFNGGGGWGSSTWDSTGDFDLSGGLFGVTAGYNW